MSRERSVFKPCLSINGNIRQKGHGDGKGRAPRQPSTHRQDVHTLSGDSRTVDNAARLSPSHRAESSIRAARLWICS
eukprot:3671860-Pyramimonas_sp.AAC.2